MIQKKHKIALFAAFLGISQVLAQQPTGLRIEERMLREPSDFYYVDLKRVQENKRELPVGVFDSGTGGLTVFNAIVTYDQHDNLTGALGADGVPDFEREDFVYLADQANMPYGNYAAVGKTDLLREHILKDAQFLLSDRYYAADGTLRSDKRPAKALVIACNTGTAYGKTDIEQYLQNAKADVKVIGVIDAGAKGALDLFQRTDHGTIGVFATAGTVSSGGYARAIERLRREGGYTGDIQVVSQGGVGLAEAIDEDRNYIDRQATAPRPDYKGPNVAGTKLLIDKQLLDIYGFDFSYHHMLCDANNPLDCSQMQINSAENYVRYHLVSMLEQMRLVQRPQPLKVLILGCTHYPYMQETIQQVLGELRDYKTDEVYRYRHLIGESVTLIDPAYNTAGELYDYLHGQHLLNHWGTLRNTEFYISVPNPAAQGVQLENDGKRFTYDFKYGRTAGEPTQWVLNTPFSKQNIPTDVAERLARQIPAVWTLIRHFNDKNPKAQGLREEERL
jgi:glutamate racemase